MRTLVLAVVSWLGWMAAASAQPASPRTWRLDYYHTGSATAEIFSVDRVVVEPLPWAGNPAHPVDTSNLGKYHFEVVEAAGGRVLYSRGFSSVFGEWETTAEAKVASRTFHESVRFPEPTGPVRIVLKKRDARNRIGDAWSTTIDPADMFVDRAPRTAPARLLALEQHGDPAAKVDLLMLGDGYTAAEAEKFERDARRLLEVLFSTSPFRERRDDFNVWGLCPPAPDSGISRPSTGVHRRTPLGTSYDAFGSERYVLTFDNRALREIAAHAPYDAVEILVNGQTYGGGGIFGQYATVAADSLWAPYIFVHEFGHHFAALADEYYASDVAYLPAAARVEPWEPNATALLDPATLKWGDLVTPGTPLPTPWHKDAFERHARDVQAKRRALRAAGRPEAEVDALFRVQREEETRLLHGEHGPLAVGAFEGANYEARGYYRPQADCIMFTRNDVPFCAVCRRAIAAVIDLQTRPAPSR